MAEWRKYVLLYGPVPVEKLTSPGYWLAQRIRRARARGLFNAAQLAELNCSNPGSGVAQARSAGVVGVPGKVPRRKPARARATPASSVFSPAPTGSSSCPGNCASLDMVRPSKTFKIEIERTSTITGQVCEEASAAAGHAMGVWPQARSEAFAELDGTVAGRRHSVMVAQHGELSCIEYLVVPCRHARSPVRLEGVTLLAIGKLSHPLLRVKGKGQGSCRGKGKGKRGKGRIEAGTQQVQPVYFGDDVGRVICTLATGDDVNRIAAALPRNAYVDISSLMPQPGQPGVLQWTESTQMSVRSRPCDPGCIYRFPYDVTAAYSKDFASMAFARECAIGTHVAIAMRITDVQPKWARTRIEPYLELRGRDIEGDVVGPLCLWHHEEGDISIGGVYVVRGLKVVNDWTWDHANGLWIRSAAMPKTIECSILTACEDVADVESITQYL